MACERERDTDHLISHPLGRMVGPDEAADDELSEVTVAGLLLLVAAVTGAACSESDDGAACDGTSMDGGVTGGSSALLLLTGMTVTLWLRVPAVV